LQKRLNAAPSNDTAHERHHTEEQATALTKEIEELIVRLQEVETQIRPAVRACDSDSTEPLSFSRCSNRCLIATHIVTQYSLGDDCSYLWLASTDSLASFELPAVSK
jgi:hypothetical protein